MYTKITDPNTGLTHTTDSPEAKQLIQNYISFLQTGGSTALITSVAVTTPPVIVFVAGITLFSLGSWIYNVYKCKEGGRDDKVLMAQLIPPGLTPYKEELPKDINDWMNKLKGGGNTWVRGSDDERKMETEKLGLSLDDFSLEQSGGAFGVIGLSTVVIMGVGGIYAYIHRNPPNKTITTINIRDHGLLTDLQNRVQETTSRKDGLSQELTAALGRADDNKLISVRRKQIKALGESIKNFEKCIRLIEKVKQKDEEERVRLATAAVVKEVGDGT